MVYESDFYTTRRPYTRPYVSSYNVTPLRGPFYLYDPYHSSSAFVRALPHMPYTAHKRLVTIVHSPVRLYHGGSYLPIKIHTRIRPSIIAAELNRIRYLTRPSFESFTEKYLNSRDYIDFDDEAKDIRARTDNLLRKVHVYVPRPSVSDYDETSPERLRSNDYVRRIINSKNARKEIESLPWYSTPEKRNIGSGHLACIKYAGGRAQPRRRTYYTVGDLRTGDVKSDVNLMSFYVKNRKAAEDALRKELDPASMQRVQEYIEKKAAEKKLEEERRAWEEAERIRIREEKEIARLAKLKLEEEQRLAEIAEQERLEAEKQAVIERAEAARQEAERLKEDEKLFKVALAQAIADEEERLTKEKEEELKRKQKEDEEEKVITNLDVTTTSDVESNFVDIGHHSEEHSVHNDLSDQDNEAKPYEVDRDEDTQIEEDDREEDNEVENPFIDGEGSASLHQADEPVPESPQIRVSRGGTGGGEQGFDWSQFESEPEAEESVVEAQAAQVEEEATEADDQQQVFEEAAVDVQAGIDEVQVLEAEASEEVQIEETQVTEEAKEEEPQEGTEEFEVQEEVHMTEEVQVVEETQEEETKFEEKSVHDASDKENEEEEEEEEDEE